MPVFGQPNEAAATRVVSLDREAHGPAKTSADKPQARRTRRSRSRASEPTPPLGSLTQRENRPQVSCLQCGSHHITRLSMRLTDGTPVDFTSCHHCEHRTWEHEGSELGVGSVLARASKTT